MLSTSSGVLGFEAFHDALFRAAVGKIEHLGHGVDAAGLFEGLADDVAEAVLQAAFDFLDYLWVRLLHVGDALHDLHLLSRGQADEDFTGFSRIQVGEDQGDRLRVFVLDKGQQIFGFGLLQERERRGGDLLGHLLDHLGRVGLGHALLEQRLGVIEAAFTDIVAGQRQAVELFEDRVAIGAAISPRLAISRLTSSIWSRVRRDITAAASS